jgi:hypothetical protein
MNLSSGSWYSGASRPLLSSLGGTSARTHPKGVEGFLHYPPLVRMIAARQLPNVRRISCGHTPPAKRPAPLGPQQVEKTEYLCNPVLAVSGVQEKKCVSRVL